MLILWEELAPLWDQHLISSEGNILPPPQSTQLPSTKLLKVNYQASCLWAFGRHSRSISNPLQIWPTSPGSGVPSCASPQHFTKHLLLPGVPQELLSQETCLCLALSFRLLYLTMRWTCKHMVAVSLRVSETGSRKAGLCECVISEAGDFLIMGGWSPSTVNYLGMF